MGNAMTFSFITLFPALIEGYFQDSILKIAREKGLITTHTIQLREFALDSYKSVDAPQIGGGAGQVLLPNVLEKAIKHATSQHTQEAESKNPHIIFLTPCAKHFTQSDAIRLTTKEHIIFVCGRYEGIDERVIEAWADEVFCIGDFILTGGELAALCLCDSIARQIPQVLGNANSLQGESFEDSLLEAPVFARTNEKFEDFTPISEYSKGNHNRIALLKNHLALCKTRYFRPDLFERWKTTQRVRNEK